MARSKENGPSRLKGRAIVRRGSATGSLPLLGEFLPGSGCPNSRRHALRLTLLANVSAVALPIAGRATLLTKSQRLTASSETLRTIGGRLLVCRWLLTIRCRLPVRLLSIGNAAQSNHSGH